MTALLPSPATETLGPGLGRNAHDECDGEQTAVFMFTDVQGFTTLTEQLGDHQMFAVMREHDTFIRSEVVSHEGQVAGCAGDGFMVVFRCPVQAIRCAVSIQRGMSYRIVLGRTPIHVRIGLHSGKALRNGSDFFGRSVIIASRITDRARGGQILVSNDVRELLPEDRAILASFETRLRGLTGRQRLHEISWCLERVDASAMPSRDGSRKGA